MDYWQKDEQVGNSGKGSPPMAPSAKASEGDHFPWLSGHFCVSVGGSGQSRQPERVDITDTERGTHGPIQASLHSSQPGEISAPSRATSLDSLILMPWEFGLHPRESSLQTGGGQATHSPANSSAPNSGLLCSAASSPRAGDSTLVTWPCGKWEAKYFFISWRLITLQYCSGFCHKLTWISHGFTCIPLPDPPSHLPLHPIPLGLPSAAGPSTCLMHPTWAADLFHPR